ncbi:uncharacterized protein TNCT_179661, partial [Trichonephila clavata]
MKLSQTANGEENSSASTPSEAVPGPSTTTETTLSNHGRTSVSSISTALSRKRTVSSTFRSRNACLDTFEVYTFFPDTLTSKDLTVSLHSIKTEISNKISETASSKQGVKWYLNSCVQFIRKITTEDFESCTSYFRSKCCISLNQEIPDVETSIAKVIASCNEFENKGTGWEFQEVVKNKLKIAIYKPLAVASYIPLPPKLKNKKAILNIKNEDQRCFLWFVRKSVLDAHIVDCRKHKEQKIKMPENKWLEFENFKFNLPVPYTIYADFKSLIVKINSSTPDPERSFTVPIANHIPCGYAYVVIGPDGNFKNPPAVYRGENAFDHFLKNVIKEEEDILNILKKIEPIHFSDENKLHFKNATHCHICEKPLLGDRVWDHDHLTGSYRGAAHNICNINYTLAKHIPVVIHNLRRYDSHLIMQSVGKIKNKNLTCIPSNSEKYISLGSLRFLDSLQFLNASLE